MFKITLGKYFKGIIIPSLFPGIIQLILTLWLKSVLPSSNLFFIVLLAAPGAIVFSLVYWFICLKTKERQMIKNLIFKRKKSSKA